MATKRSDEMRYNCNHCMMSVDEASHLRHMKILEAIFAADLPGVTDLFVHERGHIQSFDPDGGVVVCDRCFIVELSDNLIVEASEPSEEGYQAYKAKHN